MNKEICIPSPMELQLGLACTTLTRPTKGVVAEILKRAEDSTLSKAEFIGLLAFAVTVLREQGEQLFEENRFSDAEAVYRQVCYVQYLLWENEDLDVRERQAPYFLSSLRKVGELCSLLNKFEDAYKIFSLVFRLTEQHCRFLQSICDRASIPVKPWRC